MLADLLRSPFTWAMARDAGLGRFALTDLLRNGDARKVLHGVYASSDIPDNVETRAVAAGLIMPPSGVLVDRTAAWLHGVDTFEYHELEILADLDLYVISGNPRVRRQACRGGQRELLPRDLMTIGPVRVTTPLRTALDLGCLLSRREALAALDGFMRQGVTRDELRAELPRFRGRRGVIQLRSLVPLADPRSESPGESWTRLAILDAGLPAPEPQQWVQHEGRDLYRLDLPYPKHKVAVEYDGVEFHDSLEQRAADELRRDWLRRHGWIIIVVRKSDFTAERLDLWLGELRRALGVA